MNAINIKNIDKVYKLYNKPIDRLKESFDIFHKQYHRDFYALKNVSFDIKKGETVGIIGTNGAGKSTLLKIITGVLTPSGGQIQINGTVSALLELGAGFNMDYTGIENIYMNGTILGYSKKEMDKKISTILEFADIGEFIHQPVKTYSSGMLVRLAFSISINVEPEILIIDEALAVGDAFFQAKCFNKLEEIKKLGTTILFVSHDTLSVKKLCTRAVWLENGTVKEIGKASVVCEKYLGMQIQVQNKQNAKTIKSLVLDNTMKAIDVNKKDKISFKRISLQNADKISATGQAHILSFGIKDLNGQTCSILNTDCEYNFGMLVEFKNNLENVLFGFEFENTRGVKILAVNNFMNDTVLKNVQKNDIYEAIFRLKLPKFATGEYLVSLSVAVGCQSSHVVIERLHNFMLLTIENNGFNIALIEVETKTKLYKYNRENITMID